MKLITIATLILSFKLFAAKGIIIVHEAPLMRTKSYDADVVQWVRKGDEIYVHDKHLEDGPLDTNFVKITQLYEEDIDVVTGLQKGIDTNFDNKTVNFIEDHDFMDSVDLNLEGPEAEENFSGEFEDYNDKVGLTFAEDMRGYRLETDHKYGTEDGKPEKLRPSAPGRVYQKGSYNQLDEFLEDDIVNFEKKYKEASKAKRKKRRDLKENIETLSREEEKELFKKYLEVEPEPEKDEKSKNESEKETETIEKEKTEDEVSTGKSAFQLVEKTDFFTTIDKNGSTAFIPKEYVKLLYKDSRELSEPVRPFDYDPTDYRLPEPIAEEHPFTYKDSIRTYATYGTGSEPKRTYSYTRNIRSRYFGYKSIFTAKIYKKVEVKSNGRLYLGSTFRYSFINNHFFMEGSKEPSREKKIKFGFGPTFIIDTISFNKFLLSLTGGINVFYNHYEIEQYNANGLSSLRLFKGISYGPTIGLLTIYREIFHRYDLVLDTSIESELPYSLTPNDDINNASERLLWRTGEEDKYSNTFQTSLTASIGIHHNF
jgi:hypothetical protein